MYHNVYNQQVQLSPTYYSDQSIYVGIFVRKNSLGVSYEITIIN